MKNSPSVGVGYRPAFSQDFQEKQDLSWIEVITENYFPALGEHTKSTQSLLRLRSHYPVALHGVGLSIASADPLSERYLKNLLWLQKEIDPFLITDHLCWSSVGGENLFDLLPFPYTQESLALVVEKTRRVQDRLQRTIALENTTFYARPNGDEMREEEFLNELAKRTGCRFLLDLNNVYVNSVNFGFDPYEYLQRLDLKNIAEIHLAGHSEGKNGLLIDTHSAPVKEEVWRLFAWALEKQGIVPTMIERDDNIPAWAEMKLELNRVRQMQESSLKRMEGSHAALAF